jgi:hypothetical protein
MRLRWNIPHLHGNKSDTGARVAAIHHHERAAVFAIQAEKESLLISARPHRDAKSWGGCCHPSVKRLPATLGWDAPYTNGVIDPRTE